MNLELLLPCNGNTPVYDHHPFLKKGPGWGGVGLRDIIEYNIFKYV